MHVPDECVKACELHSATLRIPFVHDRALMIKVQHRLCVGLHRCNLLAVGIEECRHDGVSFGIVAVKGLEFGVYLKVEIAICVVRSNGAHSEITQTECRCVEQCYTSVDSGETPCVLVFEV